MLGAILQESGLLSLFPRSSNTDALGWWSAWKGELEVLTVLQRPYKMRHHLDRVRQRGSVRIWTEKSTGYKNLIWSWSLKMLYSFVVCKSGVWTTQTGVSAKRKIHVISAPLLLWNTCILIALHYRIYEAVYSSINVHPWWSDHEGTTHHLTPGIRRLNMSDRTAVMGFHLPVLYE